MRPHIVSILARRCGRALRSWPRTVSPFSLFQSSPDAVVGRYGAAHKALNCQILGRTSREPVACASISMWLLTETIEKCSGFNMFDARDPPRLSEIACGSRNVSLDCRGTPNFIRIGLLIDCRSTLLQDEWLIKIHIQVLAIGFDIAFSRFYKPIKAQIIFLGIDAF
jgi:hypothetical protein